MKVECIVNTCKDIPQSVYQKFKWYNSEYEFEINIGQQSIVYAITTINQHLWYLVSIDDSLYPMYFPSQLFKIIDKRLSKYWIVTHALDNYDNKASIIKFGFLELVEDEFFYGKYLEDNPINTATFNKYKKLMENEFSE